MNEINCRMQWRIREKRPTLVKMALANEKATLMLRPERQGGASHRGAEGKLPDKREEPIVPGAEVERACLWKD